MKFYDKIGVLSPQILLPSAKINTSKWAVIACDQFTSQPEYWNQVERIVGDAPSTLNLILPEVYLEKPDVPDRIRRVQAKMKEYLDGKILDQYEGFVYVERTVDGKTRKGIVIALDLERYDYTKGSQTLIRATESTILERIPPRIRIREGALFELPHILVLIDDPGKSVVEPISQLKNKLTKLYDQELMQNSGHLTGYLIKDGGTEQQQVINALEKLADPKIFSTKYGLGQDKNVLLFAVGDGNHSLATAKALWEKVKPKVGMSHPARYALVEIENVHDDGLKFEPIHRILFGVNKNIFDAMKGYYGANFSYTPYKESKKLFSAIDGAKGPSHAIGIVTASESGVIQIPKPSSNLPVGTLQTFLDKFLKEGGSDKIDYVHGADVILNLGAKPGNAGFYLPAMNKSDLFKTVILDNVLPRKTFSMGEAHEKRFYMECRRIS